MARVNARRLVDPVENADATRAKLLEAAGAVFAEHGFQATTVREICTRVGANVAAVNYHFGDKMALYTEVLRQSLCAAEDEAIRDALNQSKTPEEALRKFISGMLHRMSGGERAAWHFRIMAHEMAQPTPALSQVVDEVIRPKYNKVRQLLGELLGLGPDHDTTRLCAHSLIGQVVHYSIARPVISRLWPELRMTEARIAQVAGHIADFTLCAVHALAKQKNTKAVRGRHG